MPSLTFLTANLNQKRPAILSFVRETIMKWISYQFVQFVAQTGSIEVEVVMNVLTLQPTTGILER
jgi:hypothetical protein